ncbi:MAG: undecaprenyl/decaprenyl-phosphate alpha-N-acetylglucosaminyl 1-phosphate transferase [Salana multivorans]|uniref:MraY family glycosyltransferase n=1 Tax=Salana multivorans TaxID=120377 RepID=UPI000961E188|nr:MraY family glycosyltransferase [Salana multivorans]MBN8883424.1 undecaprenyl/decaprenyl-phosphate alpha-N-acetylglucosaminyl 1-phosphate transferase [Salana multivorans]OJX98272.1 MAG: undecaprenyl-phosphate alpha-N-acetylglucosaminyl 1-phosphate transferase [Micrococcales bacterium 73-15]
MRVYLLVMALAAVITYLLIPSVRAVARRTNALTPLRDRDVHTEPTPRLGGIAMFLGFAAALLIASRTTFLGEVFGISNQAWGILAAAGFIVALGVVDDIWDLDWITKFVGQVLAAGILVWQGVQLVTLPVFGLTIISSRMSLLITLFVVLVAINAVNFVDGLDGLASGMVAIGGSAFFVYSYLLTRSTETDYSDLSTMVVAALVGSCLGFLPHNFSPASIFMGDSGAMFLGLTVSAAGIVVTGNIDPGSSVEGLSTLTLPAYLPILLPVAVMLLPLLDLAFAVVRRVSAGKSPFTADGGHIHHRLLALGHSRRHAVVVMYLWTALFAFGTVGFAFLPVEMMVPLLAVAVVVALVSTLLPRLVGRRRHAR